MFVRKVLTLTALFAAVVSLSGCGKRGGFATVSGVVTHNGSPVDGAKIIFHSTVEVDGKPAQAYGAQTDSSGKYVIATSGRDQPGIPPGLYKVTVVKYEGKGMTPGEGMDAGQIDAALSDTGGTAKGAGLINNLLPMMYAKPETSKLSATIEVGKNKDVNFDLKGK